jgi:hypothetical protein
MHQCYSTSFVINSEINSEGEVMNNFTYDNKLKTLWDQLESLVDSIHGWTPIDQLFTLYILTISTNNLSGDIIEVGSWCGRSSVVLAKAAKTLRDTRVYCVDLFPEKKDWKQNEDGSYSFDIILNNKLYTGYQEQTVWKEAFESQTSTIYELYNGVLDCFNETIKSRGMEDIVKPHRGDLESLISIMEPDFKCRLAFLDGDHGYDAVRKDITLIDKHLIAGGWICFDDAFTCYDGVSRAITELIIDNPNYAHCQQLTRKLFVAQKNIH